MVPVLPPPISWATFDFSYLEDLLNIKKEYIQHHDQQNKTVMQVAVEKGLLTVVEKLIDLGVDLEQCYNVRKQNGKTVYYEKLIHVAVKSCSIPMVQLLLEKKADKKAETTEGLNLLDLACQGGHLGLVKFLIGIFVPNSKTRTSGNLAVVLSRRVGFKKGYVTLIDDKYRHYQLLHFACSSGHLEIVKYLLELKADPDAIKNINKTFLIPEEVSPIAVSVRNGHLSVVKLLLENNALLRPCTSLLLALQVKNLDMFDFLYTKVKEKCDFTLLRVPGDTGYNGTSLSFMDKASQRDRIDILRYLHKNGVNLITSCSQWGEDPIYYANTLEVHQFLFSLGAKLNKMYKKKSLNDPESWANLIEKRLSLLKPLNLEWNKNQYNILTFLLSNGANFIESQSDTQGKMGKDRLMGQDILFSEIEKILKKLEFQKKSNPLIVLDPIKKGINNSIVLARKMRCKQILEIRDFPTVLAEIISEYDLFIHPFP